MVGELEDVTNGGGVRRILNFVEGGDVEEKRAQHVSVWGQADRKSVVRESELSTNKMNIRAPGHARCAAILPWTVSS